MKKKEVKEFYGKDYKPNHKAVPVMYKGTQYWSKAQCMAIEGITRKDLDKYLIEQDIIDKMDPVDL